MKSAQRRNIVRSLRKVASSMRRLGLRMDYYGGFGSMGIHGREMLGASRLASEWASEIENETKRKASR